jgi:hypothetical protein
MNTHAEKIASPLNFFKHPSEIERDPELSLVDKVKLLQNWLDDIKLRQIAEEENMGPATETRYYSADVEALLNKYKKELAQDAY